MAYATGFWKEMRGVGWIFLWAVREWCSLLISECLLFNNQQNKGWVLLSCLTTLLCVKRGKNTEYNRSLFRCLGWKLHQVKGGKKWHSPTGAPRLENAWGVDFEPLHGPQDVHSQFLSELQQGGGQKPPESPGITLYPRKKIYLPKPYMDWNFCY